MSTRRLLSISGSYYVSLPVSWVKSLGLEKGSPLRVEVASDSSIIIKPIMVERETEAKSIRISVDEFLRRRIISAYLSGYDIIEIHGRGVLSETVKSIIYDVAGSLLGLEVVEDKGDKVILQCFVGGYRDLSNVIRRMNEISKSMYRDSIRALLNNDKRLAKLVIDRDNVVDKLYFYSVRIIRSSISNLCKLLASGEADGVKLMDYRFIVHYIERLSDLGEKLANTVMDILASGFRADGKIRKSLTRLTDRLCLLQDNVLVAYSRRNLKLASESYKLFRSILSDCERLREEYPELERLFTSIVEIGSMIIDIADLVF